MESRGGCLALAGKTSLVWQGGLGSSSPATSPEQRPLTAAVMETRQRIWVYTACFGCTAKDCARKGRMTSLA